MKIASGALDRRLEIFTATEAQDEFGQVHATFTPGATIAAQRLELRTQDAARAGQRDTYATSRYLIRYRSDLRTSMRVREGARLFDIRAIDEPDRRATMILTVEEVMSFDPTPVVPANVVTFNGSPLSFSGDFITSPQGLAV